MIRHGGEHAALEAELRDWLGRRADVVTPETLRPGEVPLPPTRAARGPLRLRWAVPAATLALAAAGWAVLGLGTGSDAPRPVVVPPAAPGATADATGVSTIPTTPPSPATEAPTTPPTTNPRQVATTPREPPTAPPGRTAPPRTAPPLPGR
ncbi:hypothetical protein [Embleya sp. AB8]|uniref:hypothetical protein n=1 Tax=Embleya sp. AB8 TaxID=3156304 RepID=UPI003C76E165